MTPVRRTPGRDEIRDLLDDAGARPTPSPQPEFVAGLRSRFADPTSDGAPVIVLHQPPSRRVSRPVLTGVAAAVAALALAGSFAGWFDGGDEATKVRSLALASAVDTVVVLPDGDQVLGTVGLILPDDAIVRTGPNGAATVGRTQLGPQQEAVVNAGQLRLRAPTVGPVGPAPTVPAPPSTALPTTTVPPTTTTTRRPGPGIILPTLPTLPTLPKPRH